MTEGSGSASSSSEDEDDQVSARVAAAAVSGEALQAAAAAAGGRSRGRRLTAKGKDEEGNADNEDKEEDDRDYAPQPLKAYQIKGQDALHRFLDRTFAPSLVALAEDITDDASHKKKRQKHKKDKVSIKEVKQDLPVDANESGDDDGFKFFSCVPSGVPALLCSPAPSGPPQTHSAVKNRRRRPIFNDNIGSKQERIEAAVVDANQITHFAAIAAIKAEAHIINPATVEPDCDPPARRPKVVTQVLRRIGRHAKACNRVVRFAPVEKEEETAKQAKKGIKREVSKAVKKEMRKEVRQEANKEVENGVMHTGLSVSNDTPEHRKRKDRLDGEEHQQTGGTTVDSQPIDGEVNDLAEETPKTKRKSQRARQKAKKRTLKEQTIQGT